MNFPITFSPSRSNKVFYGWYIVGVGFLSHVACAFHMSSTLSVFLKLLTEDRGGSRGLFSLLRSGEILIGAAMATLLGPMVDRFGGRWLMAGSALSAGLGFALMSQVGAFWHIRQSSLIMFLVQSAGLAVVLTTQPGGAGLRGLFLYGIGVSGGGVLQELIWANNFGRISLGMVRGLGILITHAFGAAGAPFFGSVHDVTGSYRLSFLAFVVALMIAAYLSLAIRAPQKNSAPAS